MGRCLIYIFEIDSLLLSRNLIYLWRLLSNQCFDPQFLFSNQKSLPYIVWSSFGCSIDNICKWEYRLLFRQPFFSSSLKKAVQVNKQPKRSRMNPEWYSSSAGELLLPCQCLYLHTPDSSRFKDWGIVARHSKLTHTACALSTYHHLVLNYLSLLDVLVRQALCFHFPQYLG